ncbi:MAG: hypothetical protein QOK48_977 [Blastocatellia bacterium]|nr:hypothetical protein [Blastocatellia bacterium]
MAEKIRILFLSANPWTTSRIRVDKEAREIFEKLEEGRYRDRFDLKKHAAIRPGDLQRLLMKHEPHIVHFSGHGSKAKKIILEGAPGCGKQVDPRGLVDVFRLYSRHLRLVLLNACFTKGQAQALTEVIDYSVGISKAIGDRAGVTFAGAFYRALGFGRSVREAFDSAKAELKLTKTPRSQGIELFVRNGVPIDESFPSFDTKVGDDNQEMLPVAVRHLLAGDATDLESGFVQRAMLNGGLIVKQTRERFEGGTKVLEKSVVSYFRLRC